MRAGEGLRCERRLCSGVGPIQAVRWVVAAAATGDSFLMSDTCGG